MFREEYYPYGETAFGSYSKKRYRFAGKELDESTGLYHFGARYYRPWTARFVSVDPLATKTPNFSSYHYANCNPIGNIDVMGLSSAPSKPKTHGNSPGGGGGAKGPRAEGPSAPGGGGGGSGGSNEKGGGSKDTGPKGDGGASGNNGKAGGGGAADGGSLPTFPNEFGTRSEVISLFKHSFNYFDRINGTGNSSNSPDNLFEGVNEDFEPYRWLENPGDALVELNSEGYIKLNSENLSSDTKEFIGNNPMSWTDKFGGDHIGFPNTYGKVSFNDNVIKSDERENPTYTALKKLYSEMMEEDYRSLSPVKAPNPFTQGPPSKYGGYDGIPRVWKPASRGFTRVQGYGGLAFTAATNALQIYMQVKRVGIANQINAIPKHVDHLEGAVEIMNFVLMTNISLVPPHLRTKDDIISIINIIYRGPVDSYQQDHIDVAVNSIEFANLWVYGRR